METPREQAARGRRRALWHGARVLAGGLLLGACGPSVEDVVQGAVDDGFQGVIHVEQDGETLVLDAWGLAVEADDPDGGGEDLAMTTDTVFTVGSLTKQFTGALVMEARGRGLLALDDTLGQHLEGVPADRSGVTLHELLTHTSGFPDYLGDDVEVIDREAFLQRAWEAELGFPPGEGFAYSNVGYSLLAAVLETVTGEDYEVLLRDWLLLPLGLEQTGYDDPDWSGETVAHGYFGDERFGPPLTASFDTEGPYWHLTGNGGVLSTPADMRAWVAALDEGAVFTEAERELLWGHHVQTWPRAWYAYGWGVEDWMLMGWNVNHDGGNGYFYAHGVWWPESRTYVALYSNHWQEQNLGLAWRLSKAVLR